jgi:mRNA-degrading endonuclease RelE of RelBE toxin-antitoxin system
MTIPDVTIQWTNAALEHAKLLPKKVRRGLIAKIDELVNSYPGHDHKPLAGLLAGCFSIKYSRYRIVYKPEVLFASKSSSLVKVVILIIMAGVRRDDDKRDVYRLAEKLVESGIFDDD